MRNRLAGLFAIASMLTGPAVAHAKDDGGSRNASAFEFEAIAGGPMPLSHYRGKVLLIVNTASFCGFTRQYEGLQALHERYENDGLVVIGVPSNDFGGQEPKGEAEIAKFCQGAFGVTFPLTAKVRVTGSDAHPFYGWTRDVMGEEGVPRWNFHKFVIGRDGLLEAGFPSTVAPGSETLVSIIEAELRKPAAGR